MTRNKEMILSEVDALYALGEYIKRRNVILGAQPISAATEIIAARIAILYSEFLEGLAGDQELAIDIHAIARENRYMIYEMVDLVRDGAVNFEQIEPVLEFLVSDTEAKASVLEGAF